MVSAARGAWVTASMMLLLATGCSGDGASPDGDAQQPSAAPATTAMVTKQPSASWSRQKTLDFAADKLDLDLAVSDLEAIRARPQWRSSVPMTRAVRAARQATGARGAVLAAEPMVVTRSSMNRSTKPGETPEILIWLVALRTETPKYSSAQVFAQQQGGNDLDNPMVRATAVAPIDAATGKPLYSAVM